MRVAEAHFYGFILWTLTAQQVQRKIADFFFSFLSKAFPRKLFLEKVRERSLLLQLSFVTAFYRHHPDMKIKLDEKSRSKVA